MAFPDSLCSSTKWNPTIQLSCEQLRDLVKAQRNCILTGPIEITSKRGSHQETPAYQSILCRGHFPREQPSTTGHAACACLGSHVCFSQPAAGQCQCQAPSLLISHQPECLPYLNMEVEAQKRTTQQEGGRVQTGAGMSRVPLWLQSSVKGKHLNNTLATWAKATCIMCCILAEPWADVKLTSMMNAMGPMWGWVFRIRWILRSLSPRPRPQGISWAVCSSVNLRSFWYLSYQRIVWD